MGRCGGTNLAEAMTRFGVMQLVPRSQHDRGTIFQKILHPNESLKEKPSLSAICERLIITPPTMRERQYVY
jgi:hypothetical protein